jgi:hypothetical protein
MDGDVVLPSGIESPDDKDLELKQLFPGEWMVPNAYEGDYDFFASGPHKRLQASECKKGSAKMGDEEFENRIVNALAMMLVLGIAVGVAIGVVGTWMWLT